MNVSYFIYLINYNDEISLRGSSGTVQYTSVFSYARFYDLKRTGMLKDNSYLEEHHPDLAQFFKPEYALRPISTNFTSTLEGGGGYYQNPGY